MTSRISKPVAGLVAALILLPGLWSCGARQAPTSYTDAARRLYQKGLDLYEDENYLEAIRVFNQVYTKHPYSTYATLAELKIADSHYEMAKYIEAAAAYRSFVRLHPLHEMRAYAMFRIGDCYFHQIPGDWWFMPPAYERELGSTKDALRELEDYVATYPSDEHVPQAREMIRKLRRRLADYELYVARFYWERKKYRAVVMRTRYLLTRYPDVGLSAQALLLKAQAHLALGEEAEARSAITTLLARYPDSTEATGARELASALPPAPEAEPAPRAPSP